MPQHIADHMKSQLRYLQNYTDGMKALAKSIRYYDLSYKIYDMNMNTGVSW